MLRVIKTERPRLTLAVNRPLNRPWRPSLLIRKNRQEALSRMARLLLVPIDGGIA